MNMTGIWIGFKNKTLTKIYDTGIRYEQTSASPEVLIERHTPGLVISREHLQRLIGYVELYIKVAGEWSRHAILDDNVEFVENVIKSGHVFQYIPPALSSKGSSNVTSLPAESVIVIPVDCTADEVFISPEVLLLPPLVPQAVKLTAIVAKSAMQINFVFMLIPSFNQ